jgi:hypothetical protein
VLVLGGGNGAFASAADLSLKGSKASLLGIPEFAAGIQAACEKGGIDLTARPSEPWNGRDEYTTGQAVH